MACDTLAILVSVIAYESTFSIGGKVLDHQYWSSSKSKTRRSLNLCTKLDMFAATQ